MAMKIKELKVSFILITVQILLLQSTYSLAANLKSVRSSRDTLFNTVSTESNNHNILKQVKTLNFKGQEENVRNGGIDMTEGTNSTFIPGDAEDWVLCPDGNYCQPNSKCCDADGDKVYNCCPISNGICCQGINSSKQPFCCYEGANCSGPDENGISHCDYGTTSKHLLHRWMYRQYQKP